MRAAPIMGADHHRQPNIPGSLDAHLITASDLHRRTGSEGLVVVDCRFDLAHTERGAREYREGHVPGAVYAHLDRDLSDADDGGGGRHPLAGPGSMARTLSRLGIGPGSDVVVYDHTDASIAARLWWMLRYLGHDRVRVLDGGWAAWRDAGLPVDVGVEQAAPLDFKGRPRAEWVVQANEVGSAALLVDARTPERYRGEAEPIDPVAGHIPGAVNHPYTLNTDEGGRFLSAEQLRAALRRTLHDVDAADAVHYCGSGVTACQNLLAAACAGLGSGKLYAGSWSEWCGDPGRSIATGGANGV